MMNYDRSIGRSSIATNNKISLAARWRSLPGGNFCFLRLGDGYFDRPYTSIELVVGWYKTNGQIFSG